MDRLENWFKLILNIDFTKVSSKPDFFRHQNRWNSTRFSITQSLQTWSPGGNIFIRPAHRSRCSFYPSFGKEDEETMGAFEFEAELIIGEQHYQEMLMLFKRLIHYINVNPLQTTNFDRDLEGFELLTTITLIGREVA